MRNKKKLFCLSILVCMLFSLTACSKKENASDETPYFSVTIDGVKQYKTEEDEEVKKLNELSKNYVDLTCNIDYKSMEHAFEELDYYTKIFREEYEEFQYVESAIETAEYYEQVLELVESNIKEMRFYELNDQECVFVACEYISQVTNATDEYLEDVGVKLNTKYRRTMTLGFEKEDGEWKIGQYDITDREDVK